MCIRDSIYLVGTVSGALAVRRLDPDGNIDPTFASDGTYVAATDDGMDIRGAEVRADGLRILCDVRFTPCVARLTPAGDPQPGFGVDGVVVLDRFGPRNARDFLLEEDRIRVLGMDGDQIQIALLGDDGTLDTGYGVDGLVTVDAGGDFEARKMLSDGSGGLYVAGDHSPGIGGDPIAVWVFHLDADGALISDFGDGGKVTLDASLSDDPELDLVFFGTMALQAERLLVAPGLRNSGGGIARSAGPLVALWR